MSCTTSKDATAQLFSSPENRHIFMSELIVSPSKLLEFERVSSAVEKYAIENYGLKGVGKPFVVKDISDHSKGTVSSQYSIQHNNSFYLTVDKYHKSIGEMVEMGSSYPDNIVLKEYESSSELSSAEVIDDRLVISLTKERITPKMFFDSFEGNLKDSDKKEQELIVSEMQKRGYSIEKIKSILKSESVIRDFLVFYEQSNSHYSENPVYWRNNNPLSPANIDRKIRSTLEALYQIEYNNIYNSEHYSPLSNPEDTYFDGVEPIFDDDFDDNLGDFFGYSDEGIDITEGNFDAILKQKKKDIISLKTTLRTIKGKIVDKKGDKKVTLKLLEDKNTTTERLKEVELQVKVLSESSSIDIFGSYARSDISRAAFLIESNEPRDINSAKDIITQYEKLLDLTDPTSLHPIYGDLSNLVDPATNLVTLSVVEMDTFADLQKLLDGVKFNYHAKIKEIIHEQVNSIDQMTVHGELTNEMLSEPIEDANAIDGWIMNPTTGILSGNGPIPQAAMIVVEDSVEKHRMERDAIGNKIQEAQTKMENSSSSSRGRLLGLAGGAFNIFKAKNKDGRFTSSIVEKFSSSYKAAFRLITTTFNTRLYEANKSGDYDLVNSVKDEYTDWLKANAEIMDIRKIPEVLTAFPQYKTKGIIDSNYIQKLKETLGEYTYNKLVKDQINLIKDYLLQEELYVESLNNKDVAQEDVNYKLENYQKANNPFFVSQSFHENSNFMSGETKIRSDYNHSLPIPNKYKKVKDTNGDYQDTSEDLGNYDEQFKEIEKDPALLEYHSVILEVIAYMKKHLPVDLHDNLMDSLTLPSFRKSMAEIIFSPDNTILSKISEVWKNLIESLIRAISNNPHNSFTGNKTNDITGRTEYQVQSDIVSNGFEIQRRLNIEKLALFSAIKEKDYSKFTSKTSINLNRANTETLRILSDLTGYPATVEGISNAFPSADPEKFFILVKAEEVIKDNISKENSFDLTKMLNQFTLMTSAYAAREDIKPVMLIFKEHYNSIKKKGGSPLDNERKNSNQQYENWFGRVALNSYENDSASIDRNKDSDYSKEDYSRDRMISSLSAGRITTDEDKKLLKKIDDIRKSTPEDDIDAHNTLNEAENNIGRIKSGGKIWTSMLKHMVFIKLAWSLKGAATNFSEGQIANMMLAESGEAFTPDNIWSSNRIVQKAAASLGKSKEAKKLSNAAKKWDVLQASSNEFQKNSIKTRGSKLKKFFAPFYLPSSVEFVNQMPVVLAILKDHKIKDKNGKEVEVWESLDQDLNLLPDFLTVEGNYERWGDLNGTEYKKFKVHATEIVRRHHGDYSLTGGNQAKSTLFGKSVFTFKTFLPSLINKFLGAEQTNYLIKGKTVKGIYKSHTPVTGAIQGGLVGFGLLGPWGAAVGALAGAAAPGIAGNTSKYSEETTIKGTLLETANAIKAIGLVGLRLGVNNVTGKSTVPALNLDKTALSEVDKKNYKALMAHLFVTLGGYLLYLIIKSAYYDDDDEKDSPRRRKHNLLINQVSQIVSQANFITSPKAWKDGTLSMPVLGILEKVITIATGSEKKRQKEGYSSVYGEFGSKMTEELLLPSMAKDALGFDKSMKKQYSATPWDASFKSAENLAKSNTSSIRRRYKEGLIESGTSIKTAEDMARLKYPYKKKGERHTYVDLLKQFNEKR